MKARSLLTVLALLTGCRSEKPGPPPPPPPAVSTHVGGADPATGEIRYLALGDSISQGKGTADFETVSFPARLAGRWRQAGCKVTLKNLGVPHFTAADILAKQVPEIEAFKPTLITLQVGSNDIAKKVPVATFRENLHGILEAAKKSGARIVMFGQNDWFRAPEGRNYGGTYEKRDEFDVAMFQEMVSVAVGPDGANAEMLDLRALYREQSDKKMWADDGIHPNVAAYDELAAELARIIPKPCPK